MEQIIVIIRARGDGGDGAASVCHRVGRGKVQTGKNTPNGCPAEEGGLLMVKGRGESREFLSRTAILIKRTGVG